MMGFRVRVVGLGVVTTDHRPTGMRRAVLIAAVQKIGMEEQRVPRRHFDVLQLGPLANLLDPFQIGAGLIARQNVIDAVVMMRER